MKRIVLVLLISVLILPLITTGLNKTVKASPRTWTVDDDGPADFHNIQAAINAATDGDIILVFSGIYNENLAVGKSLAIRGESAHTTLINGSNAFSAVHTTANNVVLTNFTIMNATVGVWIDRSRYNTIFGNIVTENDDGVWVTLSNNNLIRNNTLTNNTVGIFLDSSNGTTLNRNTIKSNTYGIDMENCRSSIVTENMITLSSFDGIFAYQSDDSIVSHNTMQNNSFGIHLDGSNNNNVYHNNFINNGNQANVETSVNAWDNDYPSGGNYWSDYSDVDLFSGPNQNETGSDGIWDHPYTIDANNEDTYPLKEIHDIAAKPGDFGTISGGYYDFDDKCDYQDAFLFRKAYAGVYQPLCDLDNDNDVDYVDAFQFRKCYIS